VVPLLAAAGCLGLEKEYPDRRLYAFEVRRDVVRSPAGETAVLEIRRFLDTPRSEGVGLLYRRDESRWESDYYSQFFAPPTSLIEGEARAWLQDSGLFAAVTPLGSYAAPAFTLDGTVSAVYGDFRSDPARAVLEIQVFVVRHGPGEPALVLQRNYAASEEAGDGNPAALVAGWNAGLRTILSQLESDLRDLVGSASPR
jgi:cholesterol transport system auxiliary component